MSSMIDALDSEYVKDDRKNWEKKDYGSRIKKLKNPDSWKWKLKKKYILWNPFKSFNKEIKKLAELEDVQDDVVEALEDMEEAFEDYRDALDRYWKLKYGKLSKVKR